MSAKPQTIDEYLAPLSIEKRAALETLRRAIKSAAPRAEECISYQIPGFRIGGRLLVSFGAAAFIPKGRTMFGYTPEAAIVQVHGVGPFHIHWRAGTGWRDRLKTLDDPDAESVFKFKKGQRVVAKRGRERIRQGYDSGEIIGYEIDGEDGTLFAAEESELSPAEER